MKSPSSRVARWGVLALACVAILYATWLASLREGLARLGNDAQRQAAEAASALFVPIEKYRYLPDVLATHSIVQAALLHPAEADRLRAANVYLSRLNAAAGTEVLYLLDRSGNTLASSNWESKASFVGHNFSFRPYFQDAMRGRDGQFYGLGTVSRTPGYYLSHPVTVDGRLVGVIVAKIQLSDLDREWYGSHGYSVAVADEYGILFLSSRPDWKYRPLRPLGPDEIRRLGSTRQYDRALRRPLRLTEQPEFESPVRVVGIVDGLEGAGRHPVTRYVLQEKKLADAPWTLMVFMNVDPVESRAWRNTGATAAVLLFLFVSLLYWNEWRRRLAERESSRQTIEAAHAELERRHRQLELLTEELRVKAVTDPLGCYNRRFFLEQTARLVSGASRHQFALSIAILDVDHFKSINDRYGHPTGDMVLSRLVEICSAAMRQDDIFARFGGEEFIMALMHTSRQEAAVACERLRAAMESERFEHAGARFSVTISCGVAEYDPRETGIDAAIRRADQALYAAKHAGRNRVVTFPSGAAVPVPAG